MKKIAVIVARYSNKLNKIEKSNLKELQKLKKNIELLKECLNCLRLIVRKLDFPSKEAEIKFFKYQKPLIYGKLKFFVGKLIFLTEKPKGNIHEQKEFLKDILGKIEARKKRNIEFFRYYKNEEISFDEKYFTRGNNQLDLYSNTMHLDKDPEFSTSHDLKAAEIVAYDLLTVYYTQELENLKISKDNFTIKEVKPAILKNLSWTCSKTELVELLYGLNAVGAIKNGQAEMKKLAEICKELFDIDLGNIYKTYNEIKNREKDPTKFLDLMKINLLQKLNSEQ